MQIQNNSNEITINNVSLSDLPELSVKILNDITDLKIFLFYGNLGAGKTTLIKAFCQSLGYNGQVQSPTFSLVNTYDTENGILYHMDLYRLKSYEELQEAGIEEHLYSGDYCFIEWPQLIETRLDLNFCQLLLSVNQDMTRNIEIKIKNTLYNF